MIFLFILWIFLGINPLKASDDYHKFLSHHRHHQSHLQYCYHQEGHIDCDPSAVLHFIYDIASLFLGPEKPIPSPFPSNMAFMDLIHSRLNDEAIVSSHHVIFLGEGSLYNYDKSLKIQSGQRAFRLFAPQGLDIDFRRKTLYEKLEIFLDTIFGLKHKIDGVPSFDRQMGNLSPLVHAKLTFILGTQRNGRGKPYGHTQTINHFSDHPDSQMTVPAYQSGPDLMIGGHPSQKVSDYLRSQNAVTDYLRIQVLLDTFIGVKKIT